MSFQDMHMHTTFDDGADAPETMVCAAIDARLASVGITVHSPIDGESWCADKKRLPEFVDEMSRLRGKYADKLEIYCGMEYDLRSEARFEGFDYVIGSVHMLDIDGKTFSVDNTRREAEALLTSAGGEKNAAQTYYEAVVKCASIPAVSIVGHFDLLTKFNEPKPLYDTASKSYRQAALAAMEALVKRDKIFEINTGAISRGYRTAPYPSAELLRALHGMGGRIMLSSDAHSAAAVAFEFDMARKLAIDCGFSEIWGMHKNGFKAEKI